MNSPIDIDLQRKLFKVAGYYYMILSDHENQNDLNFYTTEKGHLITPTQRFYAIVGRRYDNMYCWVNKINRAQNRLEALTEYSTKHIAWALDEFKNNPEAATKFRECIITHLGQNVMTTVERILEQES